MRKALLNSYLKKQFTDDPSTFRPEGEDPISSVFSHYLVGKHLMEEEMMVKGTGWLTVLILALGVNLTMAQEFALSFDELEKEISIGESVRIIDKSGNIIKGKVGDISPDSLTLKGRKANLSANSIQVLQKRRKDPWWNGFLIGGGAGALGGLLLSKTQCRNDSECSSIATAVFVPSGMAIGMVTGALIDHAVTKYDTVFTGNSVSSERRFQISPVISREHKGISLSLAF